MVIAATFIFTACNSGTGGSYDPSDSSELQDEIYRLQAIIAQLTQSIARLEELNREQQGTIAEFREDVRLMEITINDLYNEANALRSYILDLIHPNQMTIPLPPKFGLRAPEEDSYIDFERHHRLNFYMFSESNISSNLVGDDAIIERHMIFSHERTEAIYYTFIKYFDVSFEGFREEALRVYNFLLSLGRGYVYSILHENFEIPNPYLLFTFNTERIHDYFSRDHARHASARAWLIEWLVENEPYESYSAFRAANPH